MSSMMIDSSMGDQASGEDRAVHYLALAAVLDNESPRQVRSNIKAAAHTYASRVIADLLELAEVHDLNLAEVLKTAVDSFNGIAYRPIEITVKGAI